MRCLILRGICQMLYTSNIPICYNFTDIFGKQLRTGDVLKIYFEQAVSCCAFICSNTNAHQLFCEKFGLKSWLWKKNTNIRYDLSRSSTDVLQLGVGEGRYLSFLIEWIWIEYSRIKIFEMNFRRKRLLNNLLNWILSWNE